MIEDETSIEWRCRDCSEDSTPPQPVFESTRISQVFPAEPPLHPGTDDTIEESILELPTTSTTADEPLSFRLIEEGTQHGKKLLVDNVGYSYTVRNKIKGVTYWTCSVRNKQTMCKVGVIEKNGSFNLGRTRNHVHPAEPGLATAAVISKQVKTTARSNVFRSAQSIVEEIVQENLSERQPCPLLPKTANLKRTANRARQKLRPDDPTDLDFEISTDHLPEEFLIGDVRCGGFRHLVFATPRQLDVLRSARTWYLDGTFKVVKDPFVQLFSVHAFVRSGTDTKQLPLAFCLMSRRRRKDY